MKPRPLAVIKNRRPNSVALLAPPRSVQFSSVQFSSVQLRSAGCRLQADSCRLHRCRPTAASCRPGCRRAHPAVPGCSTAFRGAAGDPWPCQAPLQQGGVEGGMVVTCRVLGWVRVLGHAPHVSVLFRTLMKQNEIRPGLQGFQHAVHFCDTIFDFVSRQLDAPRRPIDPGLN